GDGVGLGRVERQGRHGLDRREVYAYHGVIHGPVLGLELFVLARAAVHGEVLLDAPVRRPDGAEAGGLRRHDVYAYAVVHGEVFYAGAGELEDLVLHEAVFVHGAAEREGHIVRADAARGSAGEVDEHDLGVGHVVGVLEELLDDLGPALAYAHGA